MPPARAGRQSANSFFTIAILIFYASGSTYRGYRPILPLQLLSRCDKANNESYTWRIPAQYSGPQSSSRFPKRSRFLWSRIRSGLPIWKPRRNTSTMAVQAWAPLLPPTIRLYDYWTFTSRRTSPCRRMIWKHLGFRGCPLRRESECRRRFGRWSLSLWVFMMWKGGSGTGGPFAL